MPKSKIDLQGNDLSTDRVFLVRRAMLGFGWCCAPKHMTAAEVQAAVDAQCEPYTPAAYNEPATPWTVCPRQAEGLAEDLISPGLCDEDCNRQHWFLLGGASAVFITALGGAKMRLGLPKGLSIRMTPEDEYSFDEAEGFITEADIAIEEAEEATKQ